MATIAELLIKVDTQQIDSATASLNKFSQASKKASTVGTEIATGMDKAGESTKAYEAKQKAVITQLERMVNGFGKNKAELLQQKAQLLGAGEAAGVLTDKYNALVAAKKAESVVSSKKSNKADIIKAESLARAEQIKIDEEYLALAKEQRSLDNQVNAVKTYDPQAKAERDDRLRAITSENLAKRSTIKTNTEVAASSSKTANSTKKEALEYAKLKTSIDPVGASMQRLHDQGKKLDKLFASGKIPEKEYKRLSGILDGTTKKFSEMGASTGKTAKEIAFSMRGLPAQFTDIAVSLQGGQRPLSVFLQQGGQLKDMFGGIKPALKAMGGYILGLINPFTIAAAVIGTFTLAFITAQTEANAFNKALIMTGNFAGTTTTQLQAMSQALAMQTGVSVGKTSEALVAAVSSGKIAAGTLSTVAEAAITMQRTTGVAIADTVAQFVDIGKDPVEAAKKLDDQYNFLTASVQGNILTLVAQGKEIEATTLLTEEFAKMTKTRGKEVEDSLGYVERAWKSVKDIAKSAWDSILNVGRPSQIISPAIKAAQDALRQLQKEDQASRSNFGVSSKEREARTLAIVAAEEKLKNIIIEEAKAVNQAAQQEIANESKRKELQRKTLDTRNLPRSITLQKELAEAKKEVTEFDRLFTGKLREENIQVRATLELNVKAAEEQLADFNKRAAKKALGPKPPKVPAIRNDEATRYLLTLSQQEAVLSAQLGSTIKLSKEEENLAAYVQRIANLKSKDILTADEKGVLAAEQETTARLNGLVYLRGQIDAQEKAIRLTVYGNTLEEERNNLLQTYKDSLLGAGISDRQLERLRTRNKLEQDRVKGLADIQKLLDEKSINKDEFDSRKIKLDDSFTKRMQDLESFYSREDQLRANWEDGANKSFANFAEAAYDTASISKNVFDNALSGISDSFVELLVTGKSTFKDLANTIIKELTRVFVNRAIADLIGLIPSFGAATAVRPSANFVGPMQQRAKGGPVSANTPYLVGEKGPEIIVPNSNGNVIPNHRLNQGGGTSTMSVQVNVDASGSEVSGDQDSGRQLGVMIGSSVRTVLLQEMRQGGLLAR